MKTQYSFFSIKVLFSFFAQIILVIGASELQAQSIWDAGRNASSLSDSSAQIGASRQYEVDSMTGLLTRKTHLATLKTTGGYELDLTAVYKSYPRHALPSSGNVSNFGMDSVRQFQPLGFGWNLHSGRLYFENYNSNSFYSQQMCAPGASVFSSENQPAFEAPDGSRRTFYRTQKLIDGRITYVSTDLWQARCPSTSGAWEVYSPSGEKYTLGHNRAEPWNDLGSSPTGPGVTKSALTYWTTRIEDKRGNNFSILYRSNTSLIEKIAADNNLVTATFSYTGTTEQTYKLKALTVYGREYNFNYQSAVHTSIGGYGIPSNAEFHLSEINFPEGLKESYTYHQTSVPDFNNVTTRGQLKTLRLAKGENISFEYTTINLPSRIAGASAKSLSFVALSKVNQGGATEAHVFKQDLGNHVHETLKPDGILLKSRFLTQIIAPQSPTLYGLPLGNEFLSGNGQPLRTEKIEYNFSGTDFPPASSLSVDNGPRYHACKNEDAGFILGGIQRSSDLYTFGGGNLCSNDSSRGPNFMYRGGIRISDSRSTKSFNNYQILSDGTVVYGVAREIDGVYIWLPTLKTVTEYSPSGQSSVFKSTFAYDSVTLNVKKITVVNPSGTYVHDYAWCSNFSKGITSVPVAHTITYANGSSANIYRAIFNTASDQSVCAPNQVVAAGQAQSYSYLPTGDIGTVTDALGRNTFLSNYKLGSPRRIDRPDGTILQSDYDNNGWQTSQTSPDGYVTTFARDQLGRVRQVVHPYGSPTLISYTLDAGSGRTTVEESRAGAVISTVLDGFGRPAVMTKSASGSAASISRYAYTWAGQKQSESYRNSSQADRVTSFTYDALGRLIATYFPDGNNSTVEYSGASVKEKDVRGIVTERILRHYTANPDQGMPITITNQSVPNSQMTIERDLLGRVIGYTQGGYARTMLRNANGCVYSETHPELGTITLTPDAKCNILSAAVPGAGITSYGYDAMDRVSTVSYPDGRTSNLGYWADGKLKTAQTFLNGSSVSRVMDYTPSRKLRSNQLNIDGISMITRYDYDVRDQLEEITYPITGSKLRLNPDALGRPTALQVLNNGQSTSLPLISNIQYFDSGKAKAISHANGLSSVYTEDPNRAWPDTVGIKRTNASGSLLTIGQNFDAAGNIVRITDTRNINAANSTSDRWYRYDGMQRLVSNSPNAESVTDPCTYCYDGANNISRLKTNDLGQAVNLSYSANNRVSSVTGAASGNISYDARGNITGDGFMTYGFDAANNLTTVALSTATIATYTYDPKNQRVKQQLGQKLPLYTFYDLSLKPVIEWDRETNKITEFFYFNGMQIAKRTSSPTALTAANSALSVQASFVGAAGQGIIKITLPPGANGNIQIYGPNGVLIYTGAVTQGQVALPAASLEKGCKKYTVRYVGGASDPSFAPGNLGQVTLCKGVDLSPIFQLLLDDDETPPAQ
jgi:YD repeat-containing protein